MAKTISICNQKGGVGKTTTSINLSACLAEAGKRVLVIDIDPQANATSGIGTEKEKIAHSIYHVLIDKIDLSSIILPTKTPNLFIAPADVHLTGAQIELVSAFNREARLKTSIETVSESYDYILIDCPPSLGLLTINALTASESILIPLQCEYYAMEGLSQLLHTVTLVQENLNPSLQIEGVVLTMADYRTKLTDEVIAEAREFFKEKVYDAIISRSIKLSEAPGYGAPITHYANTSHGAESYRQLAKEVINRNSLKAKELHNDNNQEVATATIATESDNASPDTDALAGSSLDATEESGGHDGKA